jgi:hypothetical protein
MALDWSFPSQPGEVIDTQFSDLGDPGPMLEDRYLDVFGRFDGQFAFNNDNIHYSDSIFPDPLSYEDGRWVGCTCGLDHVDSSCGIHDDTSLNDTYPNYTALRPFSAGDPSEDDIYALEAIRPANASSSYLNTATHIHTGPRSRPTTEDQNSTAPRSSQRTVISKEAKRVLEAQFNINPYPSGKELTLLSKRTGLNLKAITTWYSNFRSRNGRLNRESIHALSTASSLQCESILPSIEH